MRGFPLFRWIELNPRQSWKKILETGVVHIPVGNTQVELQKNRLDQSVFTCLNASVKAIIVFYRHPLSSVTEVELFCKEKNHATLFRFSYVDMFKKVAFIFLLCKKYFGLFSPKTF